MDEFESDSDDEGDVYVGSDDGSEVYQEVFIQSARQDRGDAFELLCVLCKVGFKNHRQPKLTVCANGRIARFIHGNSWIE